MIVRSRSVPKKVGTRRETRIGEKQTVALHDVIADESVLWIRIDAAVSAGIESGELDQGDAADQNNAGITVLRNEITYRGVIAAANHQNADAAGPGSRHITGPRRVGPMVVNDHVIRNHSEGRGLNGQPRQQDEQNAHGVVPAYVARRDDKGGILNFQSIHIVKNKIVSDE